VGLNFLWTPNFDSLLSPKVWLAAAGQIFFTLSVGMGTVHCYASYVRPKDDIALNAMSAGWMNEFVEVVLGASIIIPISVGYLGIERVIELTQTGGLGLGFQDPALPLLPVGRRAGLGGGHHVVRLAFLCGHYLLSGHGHPWLGFMQDEFSWKREKAAWSFGLIILVLGMPTVLFFTYGVFDEYDYWAGTVSLVVFALVESILFAWVFGMEKGWAEINSGSDLAVPGIYRYIIKFVTPLLLLVVFWARSLPRSTTTGPRFSGKAGPSTTAPSSSRSPTRA
jgi:neurotransmitter:Na+ symporter, NSS family